MKKLISKFICVLVFTGSVFAQGVHRNNKDSLPAFINNYSAKRSSINVYNNSSEYSSCFSQNKKESNWNKLLFTSFMKYAKKDLLSFAKGKKLFSMTNMLYTNVWAKKNAEPSILLFPESKSITGSFDQGEKMPNIPKRALIAGALFVPTMIAGYWLTNNGNPPNTFLLTSHKLTALADLILLNYTIYQKMKITSLETVEIAAAILMNICFVGTMTTGALSSADNPPSQWVQTAHKAGPWLTIISSGALLYLLNSLD